MVIGVGRAILRIAGARSLKDKRRVVKSLVTRLHNRYNVAAAEVGLHNRHQEAEIGIACVSTAGSHADSILAAVMEFLQIQGDIELIDYQTELL